MPPDDFPQHTDITPATHATPAANAAAAATQAAREAFDATLAVQPDRYRIEAEIGRGGMGTVYRAYDGVLRRQVALKVTLEGRAVPPDVLSRFVEEAQATAQLEHPGIVPVHDLARDAQGRLYFTMKLVRGRTLASALIASGDERPTLFRLLQVFEEIARAVSYAHDRGVVHRDLKPQNIMLGAHAEVHVMDWGIAKVLGREGTPPSVAAAAAAAGVSQTGETAVMTEVARGATLVGAVVGTPSFMSPEQARGDAQIGPASDVYALGAILFNILAGRPPYEGRTAAEVLALVRSAAPAPSPRAVDPGVPRELDAVCVKAIAKEARDRYPSARALADDVHAWLEGLPVSALPEGVAGRAWKWAKRHRGISLTLAAAVLLALAGSVGALVRIRGALRVAEVNLERARHERAAAALSEGDARTAAALYASALLAQDPREQRETRERLIAARARGGRLEWRAVSATPAWAVAVSPDGARVATAGEGGEVALLDAASGREVSRRAVAQGPIHGLAFRPDGKALVAAGQDGAKVLALEGDAPPRLLAHEGRVWDARWSPDGALLATAGSDRAVRIFDGATLAPLRTLRGHEDEVFALAFDPSGARLASGGWDLSVRIWDPRTGEEQRRIDEHESWVNAVAWARGGAALVTGSDAIRIFDAASGRRLETLRVHDAGIHALAVSADGRLLASASMEAGVRIFDLDAGRVLLSLRGHGAASEWPGLAFAPDGSLATAGLEQATHLWSLPAPRRDPANPLVTAIPGHRREVWAVRFFPDGERLASASADSARIVDVASGRTLAILPHEGRVADVAVSPDGRLVATAGADRRARIFDAATGALVRSLEGHEGALTAVRFAGARRLATAGGIDRTARVFDVETGALLRTTRHASEVNTIAVSPDGRSLAIASGTAIVVVDVETGAPVKTLAGNEAEIDSLAFSPDGKLVASASRDTMARVFDLASGAQRMTVRHDDWAYAVAFRPDGKRLATASEDQLVRIVDCASGEVLYALRGQAGNVIGASWSPAGDRLATGGSDRVLRVWEMGEIERILRADPETLLEETRAMTGLEVEGLTVRPAGRSE